MLGGNVGANKGLREYMSIILEPVAKRMESMEVNSTSGLLSLIVSLNKEASRKTDKIVNNISTDVSTSLLEDDPRGPSHLGGKNESASILEHEPEDSSHLADYHTSQTTKIPNQEKNLQNLQNENIVNQDAEQGSTESMTNDENTGQENEKLPTSREKSKKTPARKKTRKISDSI